MDNANKQQSSAITMNNENSSDSTLPFVEGPYCKRYLGYGEGITLRVTAADGSPPEPGQPYSIEFRHIESNRLIETIESSDDRLFDPVAIPIEMEDLSEDYLKTESANWVRYAEQKTGSKLGF